MHAYGNTHCTCQLSVCNIKIVVWGSGGGGGGGGCCYDQGYTHNIIIYYQVVLPYYYIMAGNLYLVINSFSICIL